MPHVLLVDDDQELCDMLTEYLESNQITTTIAYNGEEALRYIRSHTEFDLVVSDVMMPKLDGIELLKKITTETVLPIIMLTAKNDDIDRIIGLELGADDYLSKPCNPRELLARIHAVLRRSQLQSPKDSESLQSSRLHFNLQKRLCTIDDQVISLTATEFDLLHLLMLAGEFPIPKEKLFQDILGREMQPFDRSIDVHISRLRKKLQIFQEDAIVAIRGKGYQLTI